MVTLRAGQEVPNRRRPQGDKEKSWWNDELKEAVGAERKRSQDMPKIIHTIVSVWLYHNNNDGSLWRRIILRQCYFDSLHSSTNTENQTK